MGLGFFLLLQVGVCGALTIANCSTMAECETWFENAFGTFLVQLAKTPYQVAKDQYNVTLQKIGNVLRNEPQLLVNADLETLKLWTTLDSLVPDVVKWYDRISMFITTVSCSTTNGAVCFPVFQIVARIYLSGFGSVCFLTNYKSANGECGANNNMELVALHNIAQSCRETANFSLCELYVEAERQRFASTIFGTEFRLYIVAVTKYIACLSSSPFQRCNKDLLASSLSLLQSLCMDDVVSGSVLPALENSVSNGGNVVVQQNHDLYLKAPSNASVYRRRKTNHFCYNKYLKDWLNRLKLISLNQCIGCSGENSTSVCCSTLYQQERNATQILFSTYLQLPVYLGVIGVVACVTLVIFSVFVITLGFLWYIRTPPVSPLLLLSCLILSITLRLMFWIVGLVGFLQNGYSAPFSNVVFYAIDKASSLAFLLAILVFFYTWLNAVHSSFLPCLKRGLLFAAFVLTLFYVFVIVSSLSLTVIFAQNSSLVGIFTGQEWKDDYSDPVIAGALCLTCLALVSYVILTLWHVRGASTRVMASAVIILTFSCMLLLLVIVRLALIVIRMQGAIFVTDAVFYGVGTMLTETSGSLLILLVVFLRFFYSTSSMQVEKRLTEPLLVPEEYAHF